MRGVLLVCMLALCLLLTFDNSMVARAGKIKGIKKLPEVFAGYKRCCILKGCSLANYEIHRLNCIFLGFDGGNKVACMCK